MLKIMQLIFTGLLFLAVGCQQKQNDRITSSAVPDTALDATAQIIDLKTSEQITPRALLKAISDKPMVIVGEKHDNPSHHLIEQWLLEQLATLRPQGSVILEMITTDQQEAVKTIEAGLKDNPYIRERRIQELLAWNIGWPWPLYRTMIISSLQADYPVLAGNISEDKVTEFYKNRVRPEGQLSRQPAVIEKMSQLIIEMHDEPICCEQVASMLAVQQQRDRFMAQQLLKAPKPTLLIAGAFHAASNLGVPLHLQDLAPGQKPVVVMLGEKGMNITRAEADYIWYVDAVTP
ncbi:ChaN family lipoprotein [Klebsiella sp. BIGb0407]|uniref:ChaN family lipoprotein n=1 Tax=Klebsiella sp. BIGb0407 TaxID=2940603 RepID=UPI002169278E|nr:ChaN family lipoprotein [Klebsiella sp. BIGb0407]MCS3431797.1 putative iron-regulated protein [Klebsiella sp. BIGb0407]